jgi:membrane-bound lytic murein transglycosylase MltF
MSRGLEAVRLTAAEEYLEDEDLLEMVNAGLLPMVVVDRHKAVFWEGVFDSLVVHDELAVHSGGQIAWAFRKESPQLAEVVNTFIAKHRKGTLFGNILLKRYLESNPWVKNSLAATDRKRFDSMIELFQKYGDQYDFDHLLLAALAYQESRLDQSLSSPAGAIGVMQLLPSTAADPNVGIPNIKELEPNIHAGAKYLDFLHDRYFSDPEIKPTDQRLLTFAAYNAGPAKVRSLRAEAAREGLDPNRWFGNVERIAAKRIGRETVQYVSNITKYYLAYRLVLQQEERKAAPGGN